VQVKNLEKKFAKDNPTKTLGYTLAL